MEHDPTLLLRRMREAAELALSYIDGYEKRDFISDTRTQQAVFMNIFLIGELAARAIREYPELVASAAAVPWYKLRGMRNRVAHGYYELDPDRMWETVSESLPELLVTLDSVAHP